MWEKQIQLRDYNKLISHKTETDMALQRTFPVGYWIPLLTLLLQNFLSWTLSETQTLKHCTKSLRMIFELWFLTMKTSLLFLFICLISIVVPLIIKRINQHQISKHQNPPKWCFLVRSKEIMTRQMILLCQDQRVSQKGLNGFAF